MIRRVFLTLVFMYTIVACTAPPGQLPAVGADTPPTRSLAATVSVTGTAESRVGGTILMTDTAALRLAQTAVPNLPQASPVISPVLPGTAEPQAAATSTFPQPTATVPPRRASESPTLLDINEVRPVRFAKPVTFWRNGKQIETTEAILLRVTIGQPFEFAPRDVTTPLFMYGNAVCDVIQSPLEPAGALLLAPVLGPGEPPLLWLTPPGVSPEELGREQTQAWRKIVTVQSPGNLLTIAPIAVAQPKLYANRQQLSDELKLP